MRLAAYLRVSAESQVDGYGLDVQRQAIERWASQAGHVVVATCSDEGVSGSTDAIKRAGLTCALDALAVGDADGLVVARLDRLARALTVQEAILAAVWRDGYAVFTADHGEVKQDDPDDPMRTAMRQMAGVFAQLDRALIVKRLRDGRAAKAAAGRHAAGAYPFGYRGHGQGRQRDKAPHPGEQRILLRILDLREQGLTYRAIAETLDQEGVPARRAERWSAMTVQRICRRSEEARG